MENPTKMWHPLAHLDTNSSFINDPPRGIPMDCMKATEISSAQQWTIANVSACSVRTLCTRKNWNNIIQKFIPHATNYHSRVKISTNNVIINRNIERCSTHKNWLPDWVNWKIEKYIATMDTDNGGCSSGKNIDNQQPPRVELNPPIYKAQVSRAPRVEPVVHPVPRVHNLPTPSPTSISAPIVSSTWSKAHFYNHVRPINAASWNYPLSFLNQWSNAVMDLKISKMIEYRQLMKKTADKKIWVPYFFNDLGRLSQDYFKVEVTNTFLFVDPDNILEC